MIFLVIPCPIPVAFNLETKTVKRRQKDGKKTATRRQRNEGKSSKEAVPLWGRLRPRLQKKCQTIASIVSIASIASIPSIPSNPTTATPQKKQKNTSFPPKKAFFFKNICIYQKKAVPLLSISEVASTTLLIGGLAERFRREPKT